MSDDTTTPPAETAAPEPRDLLVETFHTLETDEGPLSYTARTGRVVLREEEYKDDVFEGWTPRAELAVTAYTLDLPEGADRTERPITFVFNGGPGSSSVWLHLGVLGPRVVDDGEVGDPTPPPYGLLDNPHTPLRATDLVFIDPMSTGHSRAVKGGKAKDYLGFGKDVEQIAELIRLWCTREDRWMSPKFVCGESYGTTRAVGVAEHLLSRFGMQLNGLVLISSVLDFGNQTFHAARADDAYQCYLPTYAAIAHFHGKHPGRTLQEVLAEAETLASGTYRWALGRGSRLTEEERADLLARLSSVTGLSEDYLDRCDLRPEHWRFCTELLRDQGLTVGRIDGRVTGVLHSGIAEGMDADPSIDALLGPYAAAIHHYLRSELRSELDLPYAVFSDALGQWSYKEFEGRPVSVTDKLERVMRANPHLRVRIEYGYYDLATPYAAAEDTVAHLRLTEQARDRLEHVYFETGHMPYLGAATRRDEAEGITDFVRRASGR
ncbi:peptidase S10 [Ornithinimicrobium humiphilum]|uniref:Carboxypeptidase C (Cathepsin A) n=1 Tax=Ornithinimicrobium humiphilum TaxID=125288 RepID=A0A543K6J6_9MICO|nr:peptidase S10 [Ornithinimicrobium humiphilum]TQM90709.1 carboxypeptidase C (cathepsin A) [Ornithinimicrobium humiphilum]